MTDILVTGGLGKYGSWTVDKLADQGHDVVSLDFHTPKSKRSGVNFISADLTNYGETREIIESFSPDTVVHIAAIPDPVNHAGHHVFENNVMSAYNVLDAAGSVGANIIWASSVATYGLDFAHKPWVPDELPITEETVFSVEDPYGLSKVVGEKIAQRTVNRYDVPVTSLRPTWIMAPNNYMTAEIRENFDIGSTSPSNPSAQILWSYIDVRDAVRMIDLLLDYDVKGHETFIASADDTFLEVNTKTAIESVFGAVPDKCNLSGNDAVYDCSKAKNLLGWQPEHNWREAETENVAGPSFV